jgi:multiple sugar transport system permease protein
MRLRTLTRQEWRSLRTGLLFISPWILGFVVFRLYPFFASLYYSFTFYPILGSPKWVGLDNYAGLLEDSRFLTGIYNTGYYALLSVPLAAVAGVLLAMLLNARVRGMSLFRTVFYLPSIMPLVVMSITWLWMFDPINGVVNYLLELVGIPGPPWLGSPQWSKPALIVMSLWTVGSAVVIYLASLQDVPRELLEAAELDGATALRKIWHVTLPMISPVIFFNVIVGLIGAFQFFVEPWVMSNGTGSPADSLLMMSMYLYQSAFQFFKIGYASAQAWVLFMIVILFTTILFRVSGRLVYYGGK